MELTDICHFFAYSYIFLIIKLYICYKINLCITANKVIKLSREISETELLILKAEYDQENR